MKLRGIWKGAKFVDSRDDDRLKKRRHRQHRVSLKTKESHGHVTQGKGGVKPSQLSI